MKRKAIFLVLVALLQTVCAAAQTKKPLPRYPQPVTLSLEQRLKLSAKAIDDAVLIADAQPRWDIPPVSFYGVGGWIYSTYKVEVTHIYKGSTTTNLIDFVAAGGTIIDADGKKHEEAWEHSTEMFLPNGKNILLFKASNKKQGAYELIAACGELNNDARMELKFDQTVKYIGFQQLYFSSKNEVYDYLSTYKDIKLPLSYQKKTFGKGYLNPDRYIYTESITNQSLGKINLSPNAMTLPRNFTGTSKVAGSGDTLILKGTNFGTKKGLTC